MDESGPARPQNQAEVKAPSSWGAWAVSWFVSPRPSQISQVADKNIYKSHAPGTNKDEEFYNKEIRLIDSKLSQLEKKAIQLNEKIDNSEDRIEKFKLQTELCALEEVILGLKYDLIADVEELAKIQFGSRYANTTKEICEEVAQQKDAYDIEAAKLRDFHNYYFQQQPLLAARDQIFIKQADAEEETTFGFYSFKHEQEELSLPEPAKYRQEIENEMEIQPSSYDFLSATETEIHRLDEKVKGLDQAVKTQRWPVTGESISREDLEELKIQRHEAKTNLAQAKADLELHQLNHLQQEQEQLKNLSMEVALSTPPQIADIPLLQSGFFNYLLPDRAEGEPMTAQYREELIAKVNSRQEELENEIHAQQIMSGQASNSYQSEAKALEIAKKGEGSGLGAVGVSVGLSAITGIHRTTQAVKQAGAAVVGGAIRGADKVMTKVSPEVVAQKYKDYPWMRTPWGQAVLHNPENIEVFSDTVNKLHDQFRDIETGIKLYREELQSLTDPVEIRTKKEQIATLERDLEDARILINATNLQRLVDTMKPHYLELNENYKTIGTSTETKDSNIKELAKKQAELEGTDNQVIAEQQKIQELTATLSTTVEVKERSSLRTKINESQAALQELADTQIQLQAQITSINGEMEKLDQTIALAQKNIAKTQKVLATLREGFEEQLAAYQGLTPPKRPLGELLAKAGITQLKAVISLGYVNEFYVSPEQFRYKFQLAEVGYQPGIGEAKLWCEEQTKKVGTGPAQIEAELLARVDSFFKFAEIHPELAQAILADLAISMAVAGGENVMSQLTSGIRWRATAKAALGDLGRERQIAPPKLTPDEMQWIYFAEWSRGLSSTVNMSKAAITAATTTASWAPFVGMLCVVPGALAGATSYIWSSLQSDTARNLTHSVSEESLRQTHSMLMSATHTMAEIALQEQRLDSLETLSKYKNIYLRPLGVVTGLMTRATQYLTSIRVSRGAERLFRIAAPMALVGGVIAGAGVVGLGVAGMILGPAGAVIGIGAAVAAGIALAGAGGALATYLLSLAEGRSKNNHTWEKVKETRVDALMDPKKKFGAQTHRDLEERRVKFQTSLHDLGALPTTREIMYKFKPAQVKEWVEGHQNELNQASLELMRAGEGSRSRLADAKVAELIRTAPPGLSPFAKAELETAIKTEILYGLIPQNDFEAKKTEFMTLLDQAVRDKLESLPESLFPKRELHPSEIVEVGGELSAKIEEFANARVDQLEVDSGTAFHPADRKRLVATVIADMNGRLEKSWWEPKLQRAFVYEHKVLAMRFDNEQQFKDFYKANVKAQRDTSKFTQGLDPNESKKASDKIREKLITHGITASAGYVNSTVEEYLYSAFRN